MGNCSEQVGELIDLIAVGHAVIAQHVAVSPQALNDGGGLVFLGTASTPNSLPIP
jgi:hypothetical protein